MLCKSMVGYELEILNSFKVGISNSWIGDKMMETHLRYCLIDNLLLTKILKYYKNIASRIEDKMMETLVRWANHVL